MERADKQCTSDIINAPAAHGLVGTWKGAAPKAFGDR